MTDNLFDSIFSQTPSHALRGRACLISRKQVDLLTHTKGEFKAAANPVYLWRYFKSFPYKDLANTSFWSKTTNELYDFVLIKHNLRMFYLQGFGVVFKWKSFNKSKLALEQQTRIGGTKF